MVAQRRLHLGNDQKEVLSFSDHFTDNTGKSLKKLLTSSRPGAIIVAGGTAQAKTASIFQMLKWTSIKDFRNLYVGYSRETTPFVDDFLALEYGDALSADKVMSQSIRMNPDVIGYHELLDSAEEFWKASRFAKTISSIHSSPLHSVSSASDRIQNLVWGNPESSFEPKLVLGFLEQQRVRDVSNLNHSVLLQNLIVNTPEVSSILFDDTVRNKENQLIELGVQTMSSLVASLVAKGKVQLSNNYYPVFES